LIDRSRAPDYRRTTTGAGLRKRNRIRNVTQGAFVAEQIALVFAALLLPIGWGVLVNWCFDRWSDQRDHGSDNDPRRTDLET